MLPDLERVHVFELCDNQDYPPSDNHRQLVDCLAKVFPTCNVFDMGMDLVRWRKVGVSGRWCITPPAKGTFRALLDALLARHDG